MVLAGHAHRLNTPSNWLYSTFQHQEDRELEKPVVPTAAKSYHCCWGWLAISPVPLRPPRVYSKDQWRAFVRTILHWREDILEPLGDGKESRHIKRVTDLSVTCSSIRPSIIAISGSVAVKMYNDVQTKYPSAACKERRAHLLATDR
jgi:hypothetical protein